MKVVKVYGALRKFIGGQCRFEFEVDTPAQAIKALCVNFPGLEKWLVDSEQEGLAFRAIVGKEFIANEDASAAVLPWSEQQVFSITPVIVGAGAVGKIIAGVALVALALFVPLVAFGIVFNTVVLGVGASLIFGGVAQLVSPQPSMSGLERGKEAARLESFSFSGIVNTAQQGMPVPVIYGRAFAGSAVLSSGLDVAQLK